MIMYAIEVSLNKEQLLEFLEANADNIGRFQVTAYERREAGEEIHAMHPAPPQRAKRGSKVNSTILAALEDAPKGVPALKSALEKAGLAAGSLSTGLAALQKSGAVIRVQDGLYDLDRTREAAE